METDETVRSGVGGQVSEELLALGELPSDAEISALIERYTGSPRVTAELADELLAAFGDVVPLQPIDPALAAREVEEVAGGSWLDKIGSGSSAPPRAAASVPAPSAADARQRRQSVPPVLSITPVPPAPEPVSEAVSVQQALENLPAATYGTTPPPSAFLSQDSAPIALPLSSRPPFASLQPSAAEVESVTLEQWGQASESATPHVAKPSSRVPPLPKSFKPDAAAPARSSSVPPLPRSFGPEATATARSSSRVPALPTTATPDVNALPPSAASGVPAASTAEEALLSAEEDALLDQWSDDLDNALPTEQAASTSDVAPAVDEPEPWNAIEASPPAREDAVPLSAAERSLLDSWSPASPADEELAPRPAKPESAITGGFAAADYAAAVYAPSDSRFPRARNRPQQPPPLGQASPARPPALSAPPSRGLRASVSAPPPALSSRAPAPRVPTPRPPVPAAAVAASLRPPAAAADSGEADDIELDVDEIELDPDDLIELDSE